MHLLIVKLSAIGDVIHTLPALTTLRRNCPDATIHWLVEAAGAELLENHPALNRTLLLPRKEWQRLATERRWAALIKHTTRFLRSFRSHSYDLAIDFQGLAKSGVWMALARARRKAGFHRGLQRNEGAWLALNHRIPPVSLEMHALERGLHLVHALGFAPQPLAYDLAIDPAIALEATQLLRSSGIDPDRPFIAINAVTRWATKDWEPARFGRTANLLLQAGTPIVFTGAPADRQAIDAIAQHLPTPPPRLDGRTRLKGLAEICRRARVVLTTDTGPMHLAAAMGTPVVALFGPTSPGRTGPHGPGHQVLRSNLDCSPCFKRRCETQQYEPHACMLRLDPEIVAATVLRLWNRPNAPAFPNSSPS